jgi:hypothetical protein
MAKLRVARLIAATVLTAMLGLDFAQAVPIEITEPYHFRRNVRNPGGNTFQDVLIGAFVTPAGNTL